MKLLTGNSNKNLSLKISKFLKTKLVHSSIRKFGAFKQLGSEITLWDGALARLEVSTFSWALRSHFGHATIPHQTLVERCALTSAMQFVER